ncbi:MAG: NnrS family protein [Methylotenera sp.]
MLIQIKQTNPKYVKKIALFNLGFRPFFLGASVFAIISITSWMLVYFSVIHFNPNEFNSNFLNLSTGTAISVSASQWHAHEMLYGYTMAVVAGFLLTAVKNWTGIPTLHNKPLVALFALWCAARVFFLFGTAFLIWAAIADLLFGIMLIFAVVIPIIKAKQWAQLAVVAKLILLWVGNVVFYLACLGILNSGMIYAINGAILLFISLILMIGRRVIPFFIERGVAMPGNGIRVQLKQYKWLDISILVLFVGLFLNVLFFQFFYLTMAFSWALFLTNGYRLFNWHSAGLWRVPLLWSLYLSAWLINVGFFLFGLQALLPSLSILTLHIFTIGGIGLMTLSMMSRVSLGHTGRDIRNPSRWLTYMFIGIATSVIFRAIVPMFTSQFYMAWVLFASVLWCLAFAVFVWIYTPILLKPRTDGMFG